MPMLGCSIMCGGELRFGGGVMVACTCGLETRCGVWDNDTRLECCDESEGVFAYDVMGCEAEWLNGREWGCSMKVLVNCWSLARLRPDD